MNRFNFKYIVLLLILSVIFSEYSYTNTTINAKQLIVVIDPGHGGKDPGAVNKNIREKDVVLGIGLKLGKLINDNYPDVKVIFTRSTDVFIPLIDRTRIANRNKADLFISVHANFCGTPSTRGTETFILGPSRDEENLEVAKKENSVIILEEDYSTTYEGYDPNSTVSQIMFEMDQSEYLNQSLSFAMGIQQQFKTHISTSNRGVKQAGFLVLRQSAMPSVLVESGFLSNQTEANYLNSDEGQQHVANSIFEAFKKFKGKSSGNIAASKSQLASTEKVGETIVKIDETIVTTKQKDSVVSHDVVELSKQVVKLSKEAEVVPPVQELKDQPLVDENISTIKKDKEIPSKSIYSVQIAANTTPIEPSAINFKGLKDVRREKTDKYFRYYVGSETSIENITQLLKQIKQKFPQAFIVSFVDGVRIPYIPNK